MQQLPSHRRVLQLYTRLVQVQLAAHRPEDARSALPSCLVAAAEPSPEAVRAFPDGSERNVRFPDLQKRACAKRAFAVPRESVGHAAAARKRSRLPVGKN